MLCPICGKNPKSFNNLACDFSPIDEDRLRHGLSPLHAWIRILELLLHISYKQDLKSWQARGPQEQNIVKAKKTSLQMELFARLGLRVDYPAAGGSGNSNDGNTARRAFANYELFSEILGIDKDLVLKLKTILTVISQTFPVDLENFTSYCRATAELYVDKYPWYYMSATLHKLLIHGGDIIRNSVLPIGMYSEQAGESKNKTYREDRLRHSRKSTRELTLRDTFQRSMDASDPILSTEYVHKRQRKCNNALPPEVLSLLLSPDTTIASSGNMQLFSEDPEQDLDDVGAPEVLLHDYEQQEELYTT